MTAKKTRVAEMVMPWAGLIASILAAGLMHQIGSETSFDDCTDGSLLFVWLIGLLALALIAFGAFLSLRVWRGRGEQVGARAFVALMSLMAAPLFAFSILLPMLAVLILPRCMA